MFRRPASRVVKGESSAHKLFEQSRVRLMCVALFFMLCFGALGLRLIEVTFMGGGDLPFKRLVTEPQLLLEHEEEVDTAQTVQEPMMRREITDRNGMVLATSIATASLVANPTLIRHEMEVAKGLHAIFPEQSVDSLHARLMQKRSKFLYIKRHLKPSEQEAVNNLGVPGLFFEPDYRRVYPYGGLFAHVIGYVGVDNQGLAGIEKHFDRALEDPVLAHESLELSVDLRVQAMLRDELKTAVEEFSAIGATGIIYDIKKGEILGMANLPEFDPHAPGKASADALFNRATLGAYEMGSTFKTFTLASALNEGVTKVAGGYDATNPIQAAGFKISDSHPKGRWLTTPEIYAYSSNIGTVRMALDLGKEKQQEYLRKLGMFDPVSIEMPEIARPLVPRNWGEISTMTVSFGHGISVSPLHVIEGIASVINGGTKASLTLVKNGNAKKPEGERVITKETSDTMRSMMRLVVEHGTAKGANAEGYRVGGKTGTAEKIVNGRYDADKKIASFIGAFPMDAPRYVVLVMVDEPKGTKATYGYATGGWVAAPTVGRLVQRVAPILGVAPDFEKQDPAVNAMWASAEMHEKQAQMKRLQQKQGGVHAASF